MNNCAACTVRSMANIVITLPQLAVAILACFAVAETAKEEVVASVARIVVTRAEGKAHATFAATAVVLY